MLDTQINTTVHVEKPPSFRERIKQLFSASFLLNVLLFIFDYSWFYCGKKKKLSDQKSVNKFPVQIEWKDLEYTVPIRAGPFKRIPKQILYPMSGYVASGQVLAIMGPSGAGKFK